MDEGADRNEVVRWYINRGLRQPPAENSETPEIDAEAEKAAILARVGAKVAKRRAEGATETNGEQQKTFVPSLYQQAIFDWVAGEKGKNLVVEALAGSGKTTTGVKMLELVPSYLRVLFIAFNKHIAVELQKRAPSNVSVSTYHSLGYRMCRMAWGNDIKIEEKKVRNILEDIISKETKGHLYAPIQQIVSLVKANLTGTSPEELEQIIEHHGIELNGENNGENDREIVMVAVQLVIERCAEQTNVIDFDDMCWLPIEHDLPAVKYDLLFIDEAQDTNKNQIQLALRAVKDNGRIIAVGDRHQSLYGFRGADVDAIPNIIEHLNADVLPLSITYRNPKEIVSLVRNEFPYIPLEAADFAIDGKIEHIGSEKALGMYNEGDMVLCRCNAPLVRPAFELIRSGKKAIIRGRDIGKGLVTFINKFAASDVAELLRVMTKFQEKEVKKLLDADKNQQAQILEDKVETIIALADGCFSINQLKSKIESIFQDENEGVVFSSVHRSKGLESKRVFILEPDLMPHPMAEKAWELVQERNIEYVAYTRSLEQLIFVRGD
jgi:superfamily I DNA/RNA helicase